MELAPHSRRLKCSLPIQQYTVVHYLNNNNNNNANTDAKSNTSATNHYANQDKINYVAAPLKFQDVFGGCADCMRDCAGIPQDCHDEKTNKESTRHRKTDSIGERRWVIS